MATMRVFVAVEMAQAIIETLAAVQQAWQQVGAAVSWARPEGLHVTLKFLGDVEDERLSVIADALDAVAQRHAPFTLAVAGAGGFPNLRRPRVIWASMAEGSAAMTALAADVDDALTALGFTREDRPFTPHLTVGRVKSLDGLDRLLPLIHADAQARFGEMRVTTINLMRSELSPAGARYTCLRAFALAKADN